MEKSDKIKYMVGEKRIIGQEKKENANEKRRWIEALRTLSDSLTKERVDQEARTRDRLNKRKITEVEISENEILRSRDLVFLPANGECLFIGDLHGDCDSLDAILKATNFEEKLRKNQGYLVFLGDYLDRGDQELEVLEKLVELKRIYGERVILLRGNHEDLSQMMFEQEEGRSPRNRPAGLLDDENFREQARLFFDNLPVGLMTKNGICAVHGGIPQMEGEREVSLENLSQLEENERKQVLWNDPERIIQRIKPGQFFQENLSRGGGCYFFNPVALNNFLESIGARVMIRAHQDVDGYYIEPLYQDKLVTLFSSLAPYYKDLKSAGYCLVNLAEEIDAWEDKHFGRVEKTRPEKQRVEEKGSLMGIEERTQEKPSEKELTAIEEETEKEKEGEEKKELFATEEKEEKPLETKREATAVSLLKKEEAKLSEGFSFSDFVDFLGDVIFKPIEFIINLLDKTIDFLFMVKNFYNEYLKEDLKKFWKELLR